MTGFGERLRWWRQRRGLSQLALAGAAGTTQRHLSFLESGRASPSREMILRLSATLDVPLRQQNALLLAAGLAPAWTIATLGTPHDVTLQETRIECFFPADDATAAVFRAWASDPL